MGCRQMFITIAKMVFAKLAGGVTLRFKEFGNCNISRLQSFFGTGQTYFEHTGSKSNLASNKTCPTGGAALLTIPVCKQCAFLRDTINVGCFVTHHPKIIRTDVPITNIIAPDDKYIWFFLCEQIVSH